MTKPTHNICPVQNYDINETAVSAYRHNYEFFIHDNEYYRVTKSDDFNKIVDFEKV